jgi:hypothetical protein
MTAGFDLRAELPAADAVAFLRSLPRKARTAAWFVADGRGGLRRTVRPVAHSVCLPEPGRLLALRRVLRHMTALRVYGPSSGGDAGRAPSAWEATLPGMRLTLTLSPGTDRGLSGEGRVLEALSLSTDADAELLALMLDWDPRVEPGDLAVRAGLSIERVKGALTRLATSGRIGYDIAESAFFHRELPYHTHRADGDNPRLAAARVLVADGMVHVDDDVATVRSGGEVYRVRQTARGPACTCTWWINYHGDRGPCKHALAVRIVRREVTTASSVAVEGISDMSRSLR